MTDEEKIVRIAKAAHGMFVLYCKAAGDHSIKEWDDAEEWQRNDTIAMVKSTLKGVHSPAEEHGRWTKSKVDKGYVYGPEKNDDKDKGPLTNPNLLPYKELPLFTQMKDILLMCISIGLANHYNLTVDRVPEFK